MKLHPECLPCAGEFGLRTIRRSVQDEKRVWDVLKDIMKFISYADSEWTPAHLGTKIMKLVSEKTGVIDPYKQDKIIQNRIAIEIYPKLKKLVQEADDPLRLSLMISAAGNVIDLGVSGEFDLNGTINKIMDIEFARDETETFRKKIQWSKKLLFISDNAGEIIFDRILLETIDSSVEKIVSVKSGPVLNDITINEIQETGIMNTAKVIETGSSSLGIIWEDVSSEFKAVFNDADIIIAKGHANIETLDDANREIFFLLKAKCNVVAKELGVPAGSFVFTRMNGLEQ